MARLVNSAQRALDFPLPTFLGFCSVTYCCFTGGADLVAVDNSGFAGLLSGF
jgi:hypothetical protein